MSRERQPGRQLEPPGWSGRLLAAYYYQALLDHPPFAQDLKRLFHVLDAALAPAQAPAQAQAADPGAGIDARGLLQLGPAALLAHAGASGRFAAQQAGHAQTAGRWAKVWAGTREVPEMSGFAEGVACSWLRLGQGHLGQALQGLAERRQALSVAAEAVRHAALAVFVRRWPLPAGAAEDLAHSFRLWCALGRPNVPLLLPAVIVAELRGEAVSPVRLPSLPPAIDWSPVEGRAALMARLADLWRRLAAEAREAADAKEQAARAAGWREMAPEWQDAAVLDQAVRRLVLRCVARRSWGQIAAATEGKSRGSVAAQVRRLAVLLGIPRRFWDFRG